MRGSPSASTTAGYQDAWHHHVHVFPRYPGDNLYNTRPLPTPATRPERAPYAQKLRAYFERLDTFGSQVSSGPWHE
ncbi:hypothetical protein GCM10029976_078380 [Kribbella albertanoniae]